MSINPTSCLIAWRYFRSRKSERFISIISAFSLTGVMIGVAALIIVMSIMNGFRDELTKNIIGLNSDIYISREKDSEFNIKKIKKSLSSLSFIQHIIPLIEAQALIMSNENSSGVLIKGISLDDLKYKKSISENIIIGDLLNYSNGVVIGNFLAQSLKISVGDKIKILSPKTISTAFGSMPRVKEFEVTAIFSSGLYDYDSSIVLMPNEIAEKMFTFAGSFNKIECYSDNPSKVHEYSKKIHMKLLGEYKVTNWMMVHQQFMDALELERVAMFTILSLIICVASFNIISSLTMLVKDKSKDIAILKTIGASSLDIMIIFILNGIFIGFIGTFLGILIGVGFVINIDNIKIFLENVTGHKIFDAAIYFLNYLPAKLELSNVVIISGFSITQSLLATIYPAYRAAKLNPVDIIRYE